MRSIAPPPASGLMAPCWPITASWSSRPALNWTISPPATGTTVFTLAGVRLTILICYDAEFPEAVRHAALAGAQCVLVPTALSDQWGVVANQVMPARAFENGVYLVYCNHAGREGDLAYLGASCIASPKGEDLARAGRGEQVIVAAIDPQDVAAAQARLPYLHDLPALQGRL